MSCFGVFLGLKSCILDLLGSVLLALISMALFLNFWTKNGWCAQNLVEVLELLACFVLIRVANRLAINLSYIRESIHNEGSEEHSVRDFIILNTQTGQALKCLKLRNLNETVNVIILEKEPLQIHESLEFADVGGTNNVIKAHILKADLNYSLLELCVV